MKITLKPVSDGECQSSSDEEEIKEPEIKEPEIKEPEDKSINFEEWTTYLTVRGKVRSRFKNILSEEEINTLLKIRASMPRDSNNRPYKVCKEVEYNPNIHSKKMRNNRAKEDQTPTDNKKDANQKQIKKTDTQVVSEFDNSAQGPEKPKSVLRRNRGIVHKTRNRRTVDMSLYF